MTEKLICPVCDHSEIEGNICPNCETDLATIRMLKELPYFQENVPINNQKKYRNYLVLIIILLSILISSYSGFLIAKNNYQTSLQALQKEINQRFNNVNNVQESKPKLNWCGGFNYRIKSGDSLYMLALRFYGDGSAWNLITEANPSINNPQNLEIGQIILIPNLTEFCQ